MNNRINLRRTLALILGSTMLCGAGTGSAFDMGNMMNPSKWMGGSSNKDRDYQDGGPGGYGGGPGYGYGGPGGYGGGPGGYGGGPGGYGGGGPGGYGGGPGGYGGGPGGYGGGGPGGYGGPGQYGTPSAYGAPQVYGSPSPGAASQSEIDELRERIRVLEGAGKR